MKKALIVIVTIAVIAIFVYYYRKKRGANSDPSGLGIENAEKPPLYLSGKILYTNEGEGLSAVLSRAQNLIENGFANKYISNPENKVDILSGVKYPYLKAAFSGISGITFPLSEKQMVAAGDASIYVSQGGYDERRVQVQKINQFIKDSGLPVFLSDEMGKADNKKFGKSFLNEHYPPTPLSTGQAWTGTDYQKRRFYPAFEALQKDVNSIYANILYINQQINQAAINQAIKDLKNAGWKFVDQ